jgi:hypothetical protein
MNDEEAKSEEVGLRYHAFAHGRVREAVRDRVLAFWHDTPEQMREVVLPQLFRVASYIENIFRSNAFHREGDLSDWFALEHAETSSLLEKSNAWHARNVELSLLLDDHDDEVDYEDEEAEFFGRTVAFEPASVDWIYVRFGGMPKSGVSQCGLIGEDLEDGPDSWKVELGNMTHEAGVCVFRAYRHPDHPGHLVLMQPFFEHARYGVTGQEPHLLAIMPEADSVDEIPVLQVNGSLKTIKGFDGSLRCELGSDGEYLIDVAAPITVEDLDVTSLWVTERAKVVDVVASAKRFVYGR